MWLDSSATQVVLHTPFHPGICSRPPAGFWSQEFPFPSPNSNQMAQVENHSACLGPEPSGEIGGAAVPGACAARREDESASPRPEAREPRGVLGHQAKAWGWGAAAQGRGGGFEEWEGEEKTAFPRQPPGRLRCPGPTFSWPREPGEF